MPHQKEYLAKKQYGGTIRLGAWPSVVNKGTKLYDAYTKYAQENDPWNEPRDNKSRIIIKNQLIVYERHRHRYEFNNEFKKQYEDKGFVISGTSPDGQLVEAIELPDHPFFVGTQYHPEYLSRPFTPHPIFLAFIKACM
jgi:CTP synthase